MNNPFDREEYTNTHPECIVIGRHIGWKLDLDYSPIHFGLKYVVQQIGTDVEIEIVGSQIQLIDGLYWVFEIPSATSAAWTDFTTDADCRWDLVLTQLTPTNDAIIQSGFIKIFQSTSDRRSHAEVMLSKINSIIEGRADNDVSSYSIKSRSITRMNMDELIKWRDYYINEVARTGGTTDDGVVRPRNNTVRVRFV